MKPIFIAILVLLSWPGDGFGCQCKRREPFEVDFASSNIVALAEVVGLSETTGPFDKIQHLDLQVFATWKGGFRGRQQMEGGGPCGVWFRQGELYLIYAREFQGRVVTSMCSRTREYSRAEDELKRLGRPIWANPNMVFLPRETKGLAIAVAPVKKKFDTFDDVALSLTLRNRSSIPIRLPTRSEAPHTLIDIVIRRDGEWWSTANRGDLDEKRADWSPLRPGETRKLIVQQNAKIIRGPAEYTVQAVLHFSTTSAGYWTGYVFSDPVTVTIEEYRENK